MVDFGRFVVVLVAIGLLFRLDFVFYIVYVLVGLWLLARFGFGRALRRLDWSRHYLDHAFLGDQVEVEVEVQNRSWLHLPWLHISDTVPVHLYGGDQVRTVTSLRRGQRQHLRYHLDCNRRGAYDIGPLYISGGDPLGFVEATHRLGESSRIVIYPRIVPLQALGLDTRQPFGTLRSRQRLFEDPARLAGVRDYRPGDSIRGVHWKATAHVGALLVKKVEPAMALESAILLNLHRDDYPARNWDISSEWGIELAASLAYHLSQSGQAVGLHINGGIAHQPDAEPQKLLPAVGQAHIMQALEALGCAAVAERQSLSTWLALSTLDLHWGATLLVITPLASDSILGALHQQVRRGFDVNLLVTEPYHRFSAVSAQARHLGIKAFNITRDLELKQWAQQARIHPHAV